MRYASSRSARPRRRSITPASNGAPSRTALSQLFPPSSARARGFSSSAPTRCRGGADYLFRRHLLGLGRDDFLHRTAPAVVGQIEDDAVRVLVFDLVEGVRIVLRPAAEISGAGVGRLLGGFVEIVDPHAEMNQAVIALVEARNVAVVFQQRHIDGAVGDVAADAGLADALHAEGFLEELCGLVGIGNRQRDVTKPSSHGSLPLSDWFEWSDVLVASILLPRKSVKRREKRYCGWIPALTITSCHFLRSAEMRSASCCAVPGWASTPSLASASMAALSCRIAFTSVLSRVTIGAGVPAGA